ncbi:hypothetical protein HCN44_001295 [Aphidius gifuensis]|uniref:Uncharacterized protein n=1 Tax=Aphidius gifuensis TaxID=684658 RepID=A0A834XKU8_APHGI|nr:uncharacterized protein LOC122857026 [Aphidius gifuensis]KAF7988722.1 hypothetical protein HCN44_001295 [Aphidius gifuensis]
MVLIDRETGENLFEFIDQQRSIIFNLNSEEISNAETGEPEININNVTTRRKFQIPKEIKRELSYKEKKKMTKKKYKKTTPITEGTCFGQINPIFLFLPVIIYLKLFAVILMIFELIFHTWTHHKNKSLKNSDVYFRSPFHGITSEFCARCQETTRMDKVGKIQQVRLHRFLRQCNYMKRAVT